MPKRAKDPPFSFSHRPSAPSPSAVEYEGHIFNADRERGYAWISCPLFPANVYVWPLKDKHDEELNNGDKVKFNVEPNPGKPGHMQALNTEVIEVAEASHPPRPPSPSVSLIYTGSIFAAKPDKGIAWIRCRSFASDVFVHQSNVVDGQVLSKGDKVRFNIDANPKKPGEDHAVNVQVVQFKHPSTEGQQWRPGQSAAVGGGRGEGGGGGDVHPSYPVNQGGVGVISPSPSPSLLPTISPTIAPPVNAPWPPAPPAYNSLFTERKEPGHAVNDINNDNNAKDTNHHSVVHSHGNHVNTQYKKEEEKSPWSRPIPALGSLAPPSSAAIPRPTRALSATFAITGTASNESVDTLEAETSPALRPTSLKWRPPPSIARTPATPMTPGEVEQKQIPHPSPVAPLTKSATKAEPSKKVSSELEKIRQEGKVLSLLSEVKVEHQLDTSRDWIHHVRFNIGPARMAEVFGELFSTIFPDTE